MRKIGVLSLTKLIGLIFIGSFLVPSSLSIVHAGLYVATVPNNTLYADDFENYPSSGNLFAGTGATGTASGGGWSYYDSDTGGARNITTFAYYSCCHSLLLTSANTVSGKVDVHREFGVGNTTRLVSLSVWFSFDNKTRNRNNQLTFSVESFDKVNKYECVFVVYMSGNVGITSDSSLPQSGLVPIWITAFDDTRLVYGKGFWHHLTMTCDISSKKYVSAVIDNFDITPILITPVVGGALFKSLADTEFNLSTNLVVPIRVEFADVNNPTFTNPTDIYHKYVDDLVITDVTTTPTQAFFAANELWKAVAAMGSMMSVVTMYSSVRAYQEPDPLRRRMKLMVAVVFAVGAGTLAVFAIILSRL